MKIEKKMTGTPLGNRHGSFFSPATNAVQYWMFTFSQFGFFSTL